ncbi:MAG: DUF1579 domain-containing protein [Planctomycetota bacterium]
MKIRTLASLSAVGICAFGAGLLVNPTIAEEPPDPAAMEAAWNDYMTPGPEHAHMAEHLVGQWEVSSKWWMDPNAPPQESSMVSTIKSVMDGRYIIEHMDGELDMGDGQIKEWQGMGVFGYDNMTDNYVSVWCDSWMTGLLMAEGEASEDGRTITYRGKSPDPMSGRYKPNKFVITMISPNRHRFEMYDKSPSGEWWKNMEMMYTRAR